MATWQLPWQPVLPGPWHLQSSQPHHAQLERGGWPRSEESWVVLASKQGSEQLLDGISLLWIKDSLLYYPVVLRNRTSSMCVRTWREIYFSELSHTMVEAGRSNIGRAGGPARDPGKSWCWSLESEGSLSGGIPSSSIFFLLGPSNDGVRLTHVVENNLLYSKSTDLNINPTKNYLHSNI